MREGQTHWYGFAFSTNSGYTPQYTQYSGDWNIIQDFHNFPINGVNAPQAPLQMAVSSEGPTSGASCWTANTSLSKLGTPRLNLQLAGGDQNDPNWWLKDGLTATNHRCNGPAFVPGHLYRVQYKITWGAHMNGSVQWWIDGAQYLNISGISNMWYSGSTVDTGMYPIFANYRKYDTTVPTTDVYFGGLLVGDTQADVTAP
jgi:hypothetical protein